MHYIKKSNRYYKITKYQKIKVSKQNFYKYVKRKLNQSVYPTQCNYFAFLKIPKHFYQNHLCQNHKIFKNQAGKYVPCDFMLKNIVIKLWEYDIQTYGWDQSYQNANKIGAFINFESSKLNKEKIINLFGKESFSNKKFSKKIYFQDFGNFMNITFHHNMIELMHNKLNIPIPNIEEAYPGNLIDWKLDKNGKNILFSSNKYKKIMKKK